MKGLVLGRAGTMCSETTRDLVLDIIEKRR